MKTKSDFLAHPADTECQFAEQISDESADRSGYGTIADKIVRNRRKHKIHLFSLTQCQIKAAFIIPLLLALSGCGNAQIMGVGNRRTFTPVQRLSFSPSPGVYASSQGVDIDRLTPVRLCALVCVTTDGTLPTASNLFTSSATCTGTSTNTSSVTVSSTETITATAFPATYSGTACPYIYGPSIPIVGTYVISATGFVDSFPYSTGDLVSVSGGNWTYQTGGSSILTVSPSGIVSPNLSVSGCTGCLAYWTGTGGPAPANQSTQVTFTGMTDTQLGPAVRVDTGGTGTGYGVLCGVSVVSGSPVCALIKDVSGMQTVLVGAGSAIASTSTVKLTASGTSTTALTVTVNGVTYATYSDSSSPLTSGGWGLISYPGGDGGTHISQAAGTTP